MSDPTSGNPSLDPLVAAIAPSFRTGGQYVLFPDIAQVSSFFAGIKIIVAAENPSSENSVLIDIANAIARGATRFSNMVGYFGDICCPSRVDDFSPLLIPWDGPMASGGRHRLYFGQPMASLGGLSKFVGLRLIKTILLQIRELICNPKTQAAVLTLGAASLLQFILGALTPKLAEMFNLSALEAMSAGMLGLHTIGAAVGIRSFCSMTTEDLMREYAAKLMEP
jgi:hypothetical protein